MIQVNGIAVIPSCRSRRYVCSVVLISSCYCNTRTQVEKSSGGNFSVTSSVTESIAAVGSTTHRVAVYKGLKVAVYAVNKSDISLARHDLVELINVCNIVVYV